MPFFDEKLALNRAFEVFNTEIKGLEMVRDSLDTAFLELVKLCRKAFAANGKAVLTGVGKSGHIGLKITATLSSTGSPAVFLHPVEAMHGDLGVLSGNDILIALSYSGETDELLAVLPAAKRFGIPTVAFTGVPDSSLSKWCDLTVPATVPGEACPFNLAPTTSTTAMLTLGDALAIVLLQDRDFAKEDYARLHPAGSIGRSITLKVSDLMRDLERVPSVGPQHSIRDALIKMTQMRSGSVAIVDDERHLLGIFTDGDFRRHITDNANLLEEPIEKYMTGDPITVQDDAMAVSLLNIVENRHIDDILVTDSQGRVVGLVDIQDLPQFKLM
ncbi:MAG: KpsF/GutQ family sugar-phosphate isomerase [Lentisphaeria bacterium]